MTPRDSSDLLVRSEPVIVGMGASAGGLEALQVFLSNLPASPEYAIVIVQHLDPDHDSLLSSLLAKRTEMPVLTATDGMKVESGNIYLIAPGDVLTIADGKLHTETFQKPRGRRRPIDQWFESLATNSGSNAVAVVLSGTGTDGSNGIKAIKEHGGLVFVQDPDEAKYDGMPRSAIETGANDLVLPVAEMHDVLHDYFAHLGQLSPETLTDQQFIERAMKHVRYRTGHDFQNYKPATLLRRIAVRMSVLGLSSPTDYIKRLVESPAEVSRLFRDILINVTSFFRDPATFDVLKDQVVSDILRDADPSQEIRVWVPGCSTGQEAYSIAMLFADEIERMDIPLKVAIFGTDIDDDALRQARAGVYPNSVADEVPESFLHRYFKWRPDGYEVTAGLRDMVRFSNQSVIKDPPFSRLDMVSCRNLLIYFDSHLQDIAMRVFQYGLREGGYLLLGSSEGPNQIEDLFEEVSHRHRVFRRKPGAAVRLDLQGPQRSPLSMSRTGTEQQSAELAAHERVLLSDFAPPHAVLSGRNELLFASDGVERYLEMKAGRPQLDITKLIVTDLAPTIRRLFTRKLEADESVNIQFVGELNGEETRLLISRQALPDDRVLLVFNDRLDPLPSDATIVQSQSPSEYIQELELQLDEARQTIRTTVEELETSNEELKSSNEEMMSMNEELRSANEELTTTNDELNNKIAEVREINLDLNNLIASTKIATVFLDADMNMRSFTPEARRVFRFLETDQGRRLDDIGADIDVKALVADCVKVSRTGKEIETDYETYDGKRVYTARILPYQTDEAYAGAVIFTLMDVTKMRDLAREAEHQTRLATSRLAEIEELYDISPQAMAMFDQNMVYMRANERLAEINGVPVSSMLGKSMLQIVPHLEDQVAPAVHSVFETGDKIENLRVIGKTSRDPDDERVWDTDYYPVYVDDQIVGVGVNVRDMTEHARVSFELRRVMQELQHRVKNMLANVLALVSRAGRDATADKELFEALSRRISALAQTHKLLTQSNWTSAALQDLLAPELTHVYGDDRITMKGPKTRINARAALSLGMAIHELATNASKYGCFSVQEGTLDLKWLRQDDGEEDSFIFTWRELGGPSPADTLNDGFGIQLIRSTIEGSLDGVVELQTPDSGLVCVMRVPATTLIGMPEESVYDTIST